MKHFRRGKEQKKKTVYQGYDFNGGLIRSDDSQNKKKSYYEAPGVEVEFLK